MANGSILRTMSSKPECILSVCSIFFVFVLSSSLCGVCRGVQPSLRQSRGAKVWELADYHYFRQYGMWFNTSDHVTHCHLYCSRDDYCAAFTFARGLSGQGFCIAYRAVPLSTDTGIFIVGARTYTLTRSWTVYTTTTPSTTSTTTMTASPTTTAATTMTTASGTATTSLTTTKATTTTSTGNGGCNVVECVVGAVDGILGLLG